MPPHHTTVPSLWPCYQMAESRDGEESQTCPRLCSHFRCAWGQRQWGHAVSPHQRTHPCNSSASHTHTHTHNATCTCQRHSSNTTLSNADWRCGVRCRIGRHRSAPVSHDLPVNAIRNLISARPQRGVHKPEVIPADKDHQCRGRALSRFEHASITYDGNTQRGGAKAATRDAKHTVCGAVVA